jgi:site-specific recombinase XerC
MDSRLACSDSQGGDTHVYALEADGLLLEQVYAQDPFKTAKTRAFQPRHSNPRVIAQHGWFTLHRYAKSNKRFVALEKNPDTKMRLHEFRVSEKKRSAFLRDLDRLGVNARTLFPDLSGLCQYLNWKDNEI